MNADETQKSSSSISSASMPTLQEAAASPTTAAAGAGVSKSQGVQRRSQATGNYLNVCSFKKKTHVITLQKYLALRLCEYSKIRIRIRIRYFLVSYRTSIPGASKLRVLEIIESCHLCVINLSKLSLFEELIF